MKFIAYERKGSHIKERRFYAAVTLDDGSTPLVMDDYFVHAYGSSIEEATAKVKEFIFQHLQSRILAAHDMMVAINHQTDL